MSKVETESVAPLFVAFDLDHLKVPPPHPTPHRPKKCLSVAAGETGQLMPVSSLDQGAKLHSGPLC